MPILNTDVLTYVFYFNTYTPEGESGFCGVRGENLSSLDIARHTSQVCQSWRHLILQLPIVWGNILDLAVLGQASYEWVQEVIKRTGTAKLSIYGPVGHNSQSRSLILSLLDEHWHRVRRLDVHVKKAKLLDKRIWEIFWERPAPNLEIFVVTGFVHSETVDTETRDHPQLFAGTPAPALRRIHCLPCFTFDHNATWLSQLLSLTLSCQLETVDALGVITQCPRLESLDIQSTLEVRAKTWTQNITLPNLRRIVISSNVVGSLAYLSNITPNSDCSLILTIKETLFNLRNNDTFQDLLNIVLPYWKKYVDIHSPTELAINIEDLSIRITSKTLAKPVYFGHPKFSINLRSYGQYESFDPVVVNTILSTLSSANLNSVANLRFGLSHLSWFTASDKSTQLFWSLTSVKEMSLTPWAMHALNNIPDSGSHFPHLSKVVIQYYNRDQHFNFDKRLSMFLLCRQEAGNPVGILDATRYACVRGSYKWALLEEIQGLNLVANLPGSRDEKVG